MIVGILTGAYFYLLSGSSTLFTGINRHIYLRARVSKSKEKASAYLISCFLMLIGIFYLLYALRLFLIEEPTKEHSIILAITIALLSFIELELSIHHLCHDRKSKSMTVISFRTMGLALSFFVLVNTQSSILTALGKEHTSADAIFGVIAGEIAIALGIFLLIKNFVRSRKEKKRKSSIEDYFFF